MESRENVNNHKSLGGVIYLSNDLNVTIANSNFIFNESINGGALYVYNQILIF